MNSPDLAKGNRIREFFSIEAAVLRRRFRVIETLLPNSRYAGASHAGEEGRYVETLLRDFLNRHLPSELRALTGFIVRPATKTGTDDLVRVETEVDQHSGQVDIIIYDVAHYPTYEHIEEFCVVPPEGVIAIISVKKTLRMRDVTPEVEALQRAAKLCMEPGRRGPYLGLFAFQGAGRATNAKNVFRKALPILEHKPYDLMMNEITVMNEFIVFRWRREDSPDGRVRFVGIDCREKEHIAIQRMIQSILGVYYDPSRGEPRSRPGFVSFEKGTFKDAPVLADLEHNDG